MKLRFGGIASGLDTEKILTDMMRAQRIPVDRLFQRKVQAEWKRDDYRSMNSKLLRMRNAAFDMRLQGSFLARKVESSNSSAITATASAGSQVGNFQIEVSRLATNATLVTGGKSDSVDIAQNFTAFMDETFGEGGTHEASGEFVLQMRSSSKQVPVGDPPADSYQWQDVTIKKGMTLNQVMAQMNGNQRLGVNVFLDDHTGKMVFSSEASGKEAEIGFQVHPDDTTGVDFVTKVLLTTRNAQGDPLATHLLDDTGNQGENAELVINGLATERTSNSFNFSGTQITLLQTTVAPVKLGVTQDVDAVFDKIKGFVDLYNEIVGEIDGKLSEERHRSFSPLTNEQREALSEREAELWEEKAKSGLLRRDPVITSILSRVRTSLTGMVEGLPRDSSALHTIGITTGSYLDRGKLNIKETQLREAIANDPEGIINLFTSRQEDGAKGIARRMYDELDAGITRLTSTAGRDGMGFDDSNMGKEIRVLDQRLSKMEERMKTVESRYWSQFTAMEKALQEMYTQSDWLSQQLLAFQNNR